ncbi:DUF1367 family protein [Gallibacterium anatis]|uniref:DUF1367 family protein n=2 Tax=Gallibacterium TaxID=155493 RepID=A0A1A7PWS3_9PAST|nr:MULTISPECIES: DUF1367 family protein [Gallibacterium]MDK9430951.1 DUF1367 family protein [Gallibacterium anatis]OBX06201.1 hypothetical protein QV07_08965 [Gallibacterium genomosp. 3]WIM80075.1 DUF1367 family protein [Gallibacterium anatis]WIM82224.1 DUF1367 family protein [Gallibacterium anatis]WIM82297.1 DUF1367 family protein [Gallibacterium anatis]
MIIEMVKGTGGTFVAADDIYLPALQKFKNGEIYEVEVKRTRNPQFHRKVFSFFKFCFEHWSADKTDWKYFDERKQFDTFRKHLTVLAGFKDVSYTIDGRVRVEAKSLSYGNMEQDEFEQCYNALINAALKHIFGNTTDQNIINQLYAFF